MSEVDEVKGLNIGKVYRSSCMYNEFSNAIAEVQCDEIQKHLAESKFISVIVDGSMDSSITNNEMIYMQICIEGTVHTNFICCQVQHGTAEGIVHAIK